LLYVRKRVGKATVAGWLAPEERRERRERREHRRAEHDKSQITEVSGYYCNTVARLTTEAQKLERVTFNQVQYKS
jgi:hypothetical protein